MRKWITKPDVLAVATLTLAWLCCFLIIRHEGEFSLNDDSAYAQAVQHFVEDGNLSRTSWTWTPTIPNILIGAGFSKVFGFTHETLRLSSIFMGWIGLLAAYWLFRESGADPKLGLLCAFITGLNPFYVNLSYTFMTDVPFTVLTTISLAALVRGFRRGSWVAIGVGSLFAVGAFLCRQPGLAIPLAVVVAALGRWLTNPKRLAMCLAWCVGAFLIYLVVCESVFSKGDAGSSYSVWWHIKAHLQSPKALRRGLENGLSTFMYFGVLSFPLLLLMSYRATRARRLIFAAAGVLAVFVIGRLFLSDRLMPLSGNIIYDLGVGPATLSDAFTRPPAPRWFWQGVTILSGIGGAAALGLVVALLVERGRGIFKRPDLVLLIAFILIYLVGVFPMKLMWDRYLLPLLPPLLAILLASRVPRIGRTRYALATVAVVLVAAFGVLGTRDYMVHHRARLEIVNDLLAGGAPEEKIDAGFEYRSWRRLSLVHHYHKRPSAHAHEYVLSYLVRIPGYEPLFSRTYNILIPPREETITAHRRLPETDR